MLGPNSLRDIVVHDESTESSDSDTNESHSLLGKDKIASSNMATLSAPTERPKEPSKSVIDHNSTNNTNNNANTKNNNNNNNINNNNNNNNSKSSNKNDNNSKKVNNQKQKRLNASFPISPSVSAFLSASVSAAKLIYMNYFLRYWRLLRRKQMFLFVALIIICMFYIISTSTSENESQDRIPVIHYSHVPGMKGENANNSDQLLPLKQHNLTDITVAEVVAVAITVAVPNVTITERALNVASSNLSPFPTQFSNRPPTPTLNMTTNLTTSIVSDNDAVIISTADGASNISMIPPGYLVWSERCKMPNIDPYLPEVMKYFKREKYKRCSAQSPLTTVAYSEATQRYVLRVNEDLIPSYTKTKTVDCCYQIIERNSTGLNADRDVSLSSCIGFKKSTKLAPNIDNIIVRCRAKKKPIYVNGHAMMPDNEILRTRLNAWHHNDTLHARHTPPSVLMIGIDSISRINLIRAMPKTAQYLYNNEWFEMSGYNKVDDNTFPNLMAVLTGLNKSHAYSKCPPTMLNGLDNCNFIWNTFREHGYVTAYGEDEAAINTFNYLKAGFERPPVDFYLRPFLLGAEKNLRVQTKSSLIYCLGYQHSAEFVYEYAIELAQRFKHDPFFGLFWTNTFSHNAISDCSAMDEKMVEYLKRFDEIGTYENTIVIFFSDHGIRFGPTRATYSGHLEERLPFMFVWLPHQLKQSHPEFVNALSVNKNRLTNPYDLHMTLKHVLKISGRVEDQCRQLAPAEDCPHCQTLLEPVSHNRSCNDVAIEDHWCTCIPYQSVYKNSKLVQNLAKNATIYINQFVAQFKNGSFAKLCVPLQLKNIESAYRAQPGIAKLRTDFSNRTIDTYRIIFQTKPNNALFEATIHYSAPTGLFADPVFEITGEISRLNTYSSDSECVEDGSAKKYCSCHKKKLF